MYMLNVGLAKEICNFHVEEEDDEATLRCVSDPKADDVIRAVQYLDQHCQSEMDISKLRMDACNITALSPKTFNFHLLEAVHHLDMSHNRITSLQVDLFHSPTLLNLVLLNIGYNQITSLPENLFHSTALINLGVLIIDGNEITFLFPKLFIGLENLSFLSLRTNKIAYLDSGLFVSNPIRSLDLSANRIESLPEGLFKGKVSKTLQIIKLDRNYLKEIPLDCLLQLNISSGSIGGVTHVELSYNNITEFPSDLYNSTFWGFLQNVGMSHNSISVIPSDIFHSKYLESLKDINLSHNLLETLPDHLLHNFDLRIRTLNFGYNFIKVLPSDLFSFENLDCLTSICLKHNQISFLPDKLLINSQLVSLNKIDLSYNKISYIPSKFFSKIQKLKEIDLSNNKIETFTADMLPTELKKLDYLDLSHNKISSVNNTVEKVLGNCKKRALYARCKLDFSYNNFTVQETHFIKNMDNNELYGYLDFSFNHISRFEVTSLEDHGPAIDYYKIPFTQFFITAFGNKVFSVVDLVQAAFDIDLNDIDQTKLAHMDGTHLLRLYTLIKAFPYFYNCNCEMLKYKKLQNLDYFKKAVDSYKNELVKPIRISNFPQYQINVLKSSFNSLICGTPRHLIGMSLNIVIGTDLQCENNVCTANKNCVCIETQYNKTLRVNCTKKKIEHMPRIRQKFSTYEIYLGNNKITQFPEDNVETLMQVTWLDLSYNFITDIPITIFSYYAHLRVLNLSKNRLIAIPSEEQWRTMHLLHVLKLAGNEFPCNCSGLEIKRALTYLITRNTIKDVHNIKCVVPIHLKEKVIYNLADSEFGCPFIDMVLALTLTLSFSLFLSAVVFVVYVFRYYIRLFLFIHFGWRFFYNYTNDETMYDVFVSYSSKDSDWVIDQLVNPLESLDHPYNLCLHERDFLIGVFHK